MEVAAAHRSVPVSEPSQPSAARFVALEAAKRAGFNEEDAYRTGLVATELATNLVKHAKRGELLIRPLITGNDGALEIISIDRGPGMADVSASLADGHSTVGTAGNGLGAVRRLADDFEIYSQGGRGTVILTRLRSRRRTPEARASLEIAAVSVPMNGEAVCGDAWQVSLHPDGAVVIVADGLGHGLLAGEAAQAAVATFNPRTMSSLTDTLRTIHTAVRHTRGAAVALADVQPRLRLVKFAGIGNVAGTILGTGHARHTVSLNGTIGHEVRQFREYSYPWETDALLVLCSDGLTSHWSFTDYPALRQQHPAIVAAVLYRDFSRQRDDVTVVVARERI